MIIRIRWLTNGDSASARIERPMGADSKRSATAVSAMQAVVQDTYGSADVLRLAQLKAGHAVGDTTYRVHIDGYNLLPCLTGEVDKSPRPGFVYFSNDGDVLALRFDNWKVVFMEQRATGTLQLWAEPFVALRVPKLFNLRTDPFERADITSNTYYDWFLDNDYIALAATAVMTQFLATFKDFPPRQKAASFTIDQVVAKLENALTEGR